MLKVYTVPVSLYCAKLRIVLRHKQLQWHEEAPPGGYGSDTYKALVPAGSLPALVDGDLLLTDSEAIGEYLNEKYPNPPMLPDDVTARAKARELSRFHDTRLEPALRTLFAHIDPKARDRKFVDQQAKIVSERVEQITRLLPDQCPVLLLSDCGIPITACWIDALSEKLDIGIAVPDAMKAYLETISVHEAVADELADYRPRLQNWLNS